MGTDKRLTKKQGAIDFYKRLGMSEQEAENMVLSDLDFNYEPPKNSKMYNCKCAIKLLVEAEIKL